MFKERQSSAGLKEALKEARKREKLLHEETSLTIEDEFDVFEEGEYVRDASSSRRKNNIPLFDDESRGDEGSAD